MICIDTVRSSSVTTLVCTFETHVLSSAAVFPSQNKQAHDVRDGGLFQHGELEKIASTNHRDGLGTKVEGREGRTLLALRVPEVDVPKGYDRRGGRYIYLLYGACNAKGWRRKRALVIDPGRTIRDSVPACKAYLEICLFQLLNHSFTPNAKIVVGEASGSPSWYECAGDVEYKLWYECSVVALTDIAAGEEVTIEYADPPKGVKRQQPPHSGQKRLRP